MAKVRQLIDALAAEGAVDSRGEFTLDREKAKLKMRQFQLADPHRYVLLLVQAAVVKGASRIEFEIDADDMRVSFDGEPFSPADLDGLYTSLLGGKRDPSLRARQELAVALNAAMGLNPRWIRLESGDGNTGVRLEMRPEREDVIESAPGVAAGTRIHVKDQFRPGLLLRFVRDLRGEIIEERQLRDSCAWASVDIVLDGELISRKPPLEQAIGRVALRTDAAQGVVGFVRDEDWRARMQVLNNGVWLAEHELPGFPGGFRAVVDGSALEKDVSQTDVVRNDDYKRLRLALRRAYEESVVQACARYQQEPDLWLGIVLRNTLYGEAPRVGRELGKRPSIDALCELPLWRDTGHQFVSTRVLLEAREPGYTTKALAPTPLPEGVCIVSAERDEDQQFFARLGPRKVEDRTTYLERMARNERNRQAWRARRQPAQLGSGRYHARVPLHGHWIDGELGLVAEGREKASIRLVVDGCLLCELDPKFPLAGVVAVLQAPLSPRADYNSPHRDAALAACVRAFSEGLLALITTVAHGAADQPLTEELRRLLMAYLILIGTEDRRPWLFEQFGFARAASRRWAAQAEDWADVPVWALDGAQPHPLTRVRVFDSADGRVLSLRDLAAAVERDGELAWVDDECPPVKATPRLVVRVNARQLRVLEHVFGGRELVEYADEYERWVERERFALRPKSRLALDRVVEDWLEFEVEGLHGVLGLAPFSIEVDADGEGTLAVPDLGLSIDMVYARVLFDERELCNHWFTVGVPGLVGTITGSLVVPNASYSDLEGDTWVAVGDALAGVVADLVIQVAERHRERPMSEAKRIVMMLALTAAFGSPRMLDAYARLRKHTDAPDSAVERYAALVGSARLGRSEAHLREQLARALPSLCAVPMFPLAGRGDVGFETLLQLRERGRIRHVDRRLAAQLRYDGTEPIVVVDEVLLIVLRRLFGARGLEDARDWLQQWHNERQLAQRAQLERLEVPASAMLAVLTLDGELRGQIGIPRARPLLQTRSFVQLCRDRRPVCTVDLMHAIPVSAVLDWDDLEVVIGDDGLLGTSGASAGWIASRIEDHLDELMEVLAGRELSKVEAEQARIYVLRYLAHRLGGANPAGERDHGRLASLAVFEDVQGQLHSLVELEREYQRRGKLSYLTTTVYERPGDRLVVLARHDELDAWRVLFPQLVDFAVESEHERKLRTRKSMLRPLLSAPPEDALVSLRVEHGGLDGFLWLDARQGPDADVAFGNEGLAVGTLIVDPTFCCRGAIQGPAVRIDPRWDYFEIDAQALAQLRELALGLYEQLVAQDGVPSAGSREPAPRGGAVGWILQAIDHLGRGPVAVLREALLRLHAQRAWSELTPRELALYRRMAELPLFVLSTGRAISLQTAVSERPTELGHLALWPDDPLPTPEPVAVEPRGGDLAEDEDEDEDDDDEEDDEPVPVRFDPPPPPPPPPPPTPEERLLDAIRAELRLVRTANLNLLSDAHLDMLELSQGRRRLIELTELRVVLGTGHPLFARALAGWREDPVHVSFLASLVYTGLNVLLGDITDHHEAVFHRLHAEHVLSASLVGDEPDDDAGPA